MSTISDLLVGRFAPKICNVRTLLIDGDFLVRYLVKQGARGWCPEMAKKLVEMESGKVIFARGFYAPQ